MESGRRRMEGQGRKEKEGDGGRRRDRWRAREEAWKGLHDRGMYRGWGDDAFDCFIEHATRDEDGERALTCPKWLEAEIFDHPVYPWHALRQLQCPVLFVYGTQTYSFIAPAARRARKLQIGRAHV